MYVQTAQSRRARTVRHASRVLEFNSPEPGRRIVPYLTLDPPETEEAAWVGHYLQLADHVLDNHDLENPAERPKVTPGQRRRA